MDRFGGLNRPLCVQKSGELSKQTGEVVETDRGGRVLLGPGYRVTCGFVDRRSGPFESTIEKCRAMRTEPGTFGT